MEVKIEAEKALAVIPPTNIISPVAMDTAAMATVTHLHTIQSIPPPPPSPPPSPPIGQCRQGLWYRYNTCPISRNPIGPPHTPPLLCPL